MAHKSPVHVPVSRALLHKRLINCHIYVDYNQQLFSHKAWVFTSVNCAFDVFLMPAVVITPTMMMAITLKANHVHFENGVCLELLAVFPAKVSWCTMALSPQLHCTMDIRFS